MSGALRVFDAARRAVASLRARFGPPPPFVLWLAPGVTWACGTCHWGVPVSRFGVTFVSQVFLRGSAVDQPYWADAVTLHELGHVAMASFGRAIGEGGRHCFGVATAPGQAWSEGFATWFSADLRGDPRYVDKQAGAMLWFDIAARTVSAGAWPRPIVGAGLEQDTYENEVAAMLWSLSAGHGLGHAPIDAALASPRLRTPPFERGYTRQRWSLSPMCQRVGIEDTGVPTPYLADVLDALVCTGVSSLVIDQVTEPAVRYPYPSAAPLCRP